MHKITVEHVNSHNFLVMLDEAAVSLSYKSFGGRMAVDTLGEAGLAELIEETERVITARDFSTGCQRIFQCVGVSNAMALLDACCRDAFRAYWKALLYQRKRFGKGTSFRSMLTAVTGTKATLAQSDSAFVEELRELCGEVQQNTECPCVSVEADEEVVDGDIRVSFRSQWNNSQIFVVNGEVVSLCTRQVSEIKTATEVLCAAQALREVIRNQADLRSYVARWGGSFVFRLLRAVCPEETVDYFRQRVVERAEERLLADPRKALKELGFPFNDQRLASFCGAILSAMEQERVELGLKLAFTNLRAVQASSDNWMLYYNSNLGTHYRRINFWEIEHECLRKEATGFLQAYLRANGDVSPTHVSRYYYLLRSGLNALAYAGVSSINDATITHVRFVKSYLDCHRHCSANHISEVLQMLGRMYHWAVPDCAEEDNPFWCVSIPNKGAFLQTTVPADSASLKLIAEHAEELPEYVQAGNQLLMLMLSRAGDAFSVRVSDLEVLEDGTSLLRYQSGKNQRRMCFHIPATLTERLLAYIRKTESLRERSGSDFILLYEPSGRRDGSECAPRILTYGTYNYYIGKLLERYAAGYGLTTRQIRAEGGRRYHSMGLPSSQVAIALGNTPTVAKRHYRTFSPQDEAEIFHRMYAGAFTPVKDEVAETVTPHPMWGSCGNGTCQERSHCHACPYLYTEEMSQYAVCAKNS